MPTYRAPARAALHNTAENHFSRWYRKDASANDEQGTLAFQRLQSPYLTPHVAPPFKIRRDDALFAIGSCFARGIERALVFRKMNVLSAAPEFASLTAATPEVTGLGFTNKYNTYSIYNELNWALNPEASFPEESIVDLADGLAYDPHINPTLPPADRAETLKRRMTLRMVNHRLAGCQIAIITLGLVEVWYDLESKVFLNTTPPLEVIRKCPDRYEFRVSNFAENMQNLEQIHALLQKYCNPNLRIVVTVSPVPLMATFTDQDIIVANTYSKSLLRTVAQEWAAAHDNVCYFPSYEIVLNSARPSAWLEDLRHVQGKLVNHIIDFFLRNFLEAA